MDSHQNFLQLLKDQGYSHTKQRSQIFSLLQKNGPLSMKQLILAAKPIDKVSVYRITDLFERIGVCQRLNIGNKHQLELTDKFAEHHHHLACKQCHKVIEINEKTLEDFIQKLAGQYGFKVIDHQVEAQGLCQKCSQTSAMSLVTMI